MLRFEDIKPGQILAGVEQGKCSEVIILRILSVNSASLYFDILPRLKSGDSCRQRLYRAAP